MKNILKYFVLASIILIITACPNPIGDISSAEETAGEKQSLTIYLNNPQVQSARTMFPDIDDGISSFRVTLSSDITGDISENVSASSGSVKFSSLTPGSYSILVEALDSDGNRIGQGSGSAEVSAESASSASVEISFTDGSGTISLNLAFPSGRVGSIEGVLIDSDGNEESVSFSLEDTSASFSVEKPSGIYTLIAKLKDSAGKVAASIVESVHVIGEMTSSKTMALTDEDLNQPPAAPSGAAVSQEGTSLKVIWTDNSATEDGFEISRSESGSSEWTVLSESASANTASYTDSSVETDKTYLYRIRSKNTYGTSAWSISSEKKVAGLISAADDTLSEEEWNFYAGRATTIPVSNLIANDENLLNTDPIEIVSVQSPLNGSAVISGSSIIFTASSGSEGRSAGFSYTAQIQGTEYTDTASVTIENIEEAPSVIAASDGPDGSAYTIQQGGETYINTSTLLTNDTGSGRSFSGIISGSETGCTVNVSGSSLTVRSTGLAYQPAQFNYQITDSLGTTAEGTVYLNITPLAPVEAYVFNDRSSFNSFIDNYTPMSFEDVFNNWPRISGNNYYSSAPYSGYAASWRYLTNDADGDGDNDPRVEQPNNVYPPEGFVCPEPEALENYTFEATLYSNNGDNDSIGLVIAFTREGSSNKYLVAHRTKGGNNPRNGWGISYYDGTSQTVLADISVDGNSGGWSGSKSRVKVERTGNLIKCYTTNWNNTESYNPESMIEINLSDNTVNNNTSSKDLSVFSGAKQYGYFTYSQPNSTYLDIDLSGGISGDTVIMLNNTSGDSDDYETSEVWKYITGSWAKQSGRTIQEELGFVREVRNPLNSNSFLIKENEVEIKE